MKLDIYNNENKIGVSAYVECVKPATAVRRLRKAVEASKKMDNKEKAIVLEWLEDEEIFMETLNGRTHADAGKEDYLSWVIELEEIERGYWYISVSVKKEKAVKEAIEAEEAEETKEEVKKIDGHDYTIETMNPKGTRKYYHFNDRNSKGEKIDIEFDKVENDYKEHMINVWYKNGFIKERLKSYWHITVYATDQKGFTWGRYNPQILPGGTKINFNWILEATEENKERILHEIIKRAYNGKIENI